MRMLLLSCVLLCGLVAAGEPAAASAEAMGLRISAPPYQNDQQMRAFNWSEGTTVAVVLKYPAGGVIECDTKASKLTVLKDDKGTDLLAVKGKDKFFDRPFSMMPNINKGGNAVLFECQSKGLPAKGAAQLTVSGELALNVATQKADEKAEKVALTAGTEFKIGPYTLKVKSAGKSDWDPKKYAVTFEAKQDLTGWAEIKFLDAAGKEVKSSSGGSSRSSFGKNVQVERSFNFEAPIESATIVISRWTDEKTVLVPFNVTVTLGL